MTDPRVVVVGAGALGQAIAAGLSRGGALVTLVASASTAEVLLAAGAVRVRGALELTVPVSDGPPEPSRIAVQGRPFDATADGVVFATKSYDLAAAAAAHSEARCTWAFGVQNGLLKDDVLAAELGREHVLGGACTLAAERHADGWVEVATPGVTFLGPLDARPRDDAESAAAVFVAGGLPAEVVDDPVEVEWAKVLQAAPAYAVQMVVRDSPQQIWADPAQARAALMVMREIGEVAAGDGVTIRDFTMLSSHSDLTEDVTTVLERRGSAVRTWASGRALRSSLLQDLVAHRQTEAGELFGDLVARADRHGLTVPLLRFVASLSTAL